VGGAGEVREGRRHEQHFGAAQRQGAIQLGEAHVVADREAEGHGDPRPGHDPRRDHLVAGHEIVRLAIDRGTRYGVEQVDLAVDGKDLALRPEQHGSVEGAIRTRGPFVVRSGEDMDAVLGGKAGEHGVAWPVDRLGAREDAGAVPLEGPRLGQGDQLGAGAGRLAYQPARRGDVGHHVRGRVELYARDAQSAAQRPATGVRASRRTLLCGRVAHRSHATKLRIS